MVYHQRIGVEVAANTEGALDMEAVEVVGTEEAMEAAYAAGVGLSLP